MLFLALLAEGVWFVQHGRFNIDEGMHLNAGRLLFERGWLPYRDFPFSQGPGAPALYGAVGALFGTSIEAGRAFSLFANLLLVACMAAFARRVSGAAAAFLVVAWTAVNAPAIWTATQVRTEALAVPLVTGAAMALCLPKRTALQWALAPSLLVWATSIRLTNGLALVAVCLWIAWQLRHSRSLLWAAAGVVAVNGIVAAAPLIAFPAESWFHVVDAQLGRTERFHMADYPFSTRFWFFATAHTSFQPLLALALLPIALLLVRSDRGERPGSPDAFDPRSVVATALALAVLTYLPHVLFRIGFFSYFVNASVLITLAVAVTVPQLARGRRLRAVAVWALVAAAWLVAAQLTYRHLDRWALRPAAALASLERITEPIRRIAPEPCTMLTFETHLAVASRCDVTPGLEYSYFSFFPDLPDAEAIRSRVMNRAELLAQIEAGVPDFVVLTDDAVDKILNPPPDPAAATRTLAGERERIRSERRGRAGAGDAIAAFAPLRGRYVRISRARVPVGPVHRWWTTVEVFARKDLAAPPTP